MTTADDLLPVGLEDALPDRARKITSAMRAVLDAMDGHGYDRVRPPLVEFEQWFPERFISITHRLFQRGNIVHKLVSRTAVFEHNNASDLKYGKARQSLKGRNPSFRHTH